MKTGLKIMSWAAVVLGALAILSGFTEVNAAEASYSFLGGLFFGVEGLLALLYMRSKNE